MITSRLRRYQSALRHAREQSMLVVAATSSVKGRRAARKPVSEAEAIEAEIDAIIAEQELRTLADIDAAMRHIEQDPDSFGKCVVCGAVIPAERLEIAPWEERCDAHPGDDF